MNASQAQQAKIQADISKYAPEEVQKLLTKVDLKKMEKFEASDLIDYIKDDMWDQVKLILSALEIRCECGNLTLDESKFCKECT